MINITKDMRGRFWPVLHEARIGEQIVYHRGPTCGGNHRHDAMSAYDKGLVTLVQKRNGPADFSYTAIKTKPGEKK